MSVADFALGLAAIGAGVMVATLGTCALVLAWLRVNRWIADRMPPDLGIAVGLGLTFAWTAILTGILSAAVLTTMTVGRALVGA